MLKSIFDALIVGLALYFFLAGVFMTVDAIVELIIKQINKRKILKKLDKITEMKKV